MKNIIERLMSLKIAHNICEDDSHYSCPASGECTDDYYEDNDLFSADYCTCGATQHNKELELIIIEIDKIL